MRIALLSDIHGNLTALDAVLADARALGVDAFRVIGDFAAIGPEPVAVLERVFGLNDALFTRGNTDRYLVTGERPPPDLAAVQDDPRLVPLYAGIAASFAWTQGCLTGTGWLKTLEQLPLEIRFDAPDGTRILAVHAAPGTDDGAGVHSGRTDAELATLFEGCDADIVFVGHTHEPLVRHVGDRTVVNLGSVSNPRPADIRASYVVLELTTSSVEFTHRRVAYDYDAFADSVRASRHPSSDFILGHFHGGYRQPS
jgi:putative phosphoesterase